MTDHPQDPPGERSAIFTRAEVGSGVILLGVKGELDEACAPALAGHLQRAMDQVRLVILDLHLVTRAEPVCALAVVAAGAEAHQDGRRLVIIRAPYEVWRLFNAVGAHRHAHFLAADRSPARSVRPRRTLTPEPGATIDPLANPVNARVLSARTMAIDDDWLWLQDQHGQIHRAWAPPQKAHGQIPKTVEVYLDDRDEVNGWRAAGQLAVNQRGLDQLTIPPQLGRALTCQAACGLRWLAPAAARIIARGEGCLTCGGALAATE